jgi:hypothetical protein
MNDKRLRLHPDDHLALMLAENNRSSISKS